MDTSNKVRVMDQDERQMKRTNSGGVRDPSDPKHYPPLGGTEGAVSPVGPAERRLSPLGSFKESLMSLPAIDKIQVESAGASGSKASLTSLPGVGKQRLAKPDQAATAGSSSPKIMAERLAPARDDAGTAEPDLLTGPSQQVARQNILEEGFAFPRKVVSQASHRRRTADEQAATGKFYKKVANGNTFAPLAEDAEQVATLESSPEVDNTGATVPDVDEGTHKRGRWGRLWGKTLDVVREHPVATSVAVSAITIGVMLLSRRRR